MNVRYRFFLILVALSVILAACGGPPAEATKSSKETLQLGTPVEVVSAERGYIRATFKASAFLEAEESTEVIPRVNGIIEEIYVEEGDFVEPGQALAKLESSRYQLAVQQIEAELRNITQELTRNQRLAEQKLVSEDTLSRLASQRDTLSARLELAKIDLEETILRAPIRGHVAQRYARVGRLVQTWQTESTFLLVNNTQLRATVHLPEHTFQYVQPELPVTLKLQALPELSLQAKIARISPVIDAQSGTYRVVISIPNEDFKLRSGMFGSLNIHYAQKENALRIPQEALIQIDQQSHVFVVKNKTEAPTEHKEYQAQRVEVTTGIREDGWIEITAGIEENSWVVITGQNNLRDGSDVEVINL